MHENGLPRLPVALRAGRAVAGALVLAAALLCAPATAPATNGDNLINVSPASRAMGGTAIAAPQDAVSAVFANPAAMCFGPYCPTSQLDVGLTLFKPEVSTEITKGDGKFEADSEDKIYPIPAAGVSVPITKAPPFWRFGFAAYGVSGLGVDYRDTDVDRVDAFGNRHASGTFTDLQRLKAAPAIAVQPLDTLSLGFAFHVHRATLDLGNGMKEGYAVGVQPGIIFRPLPGLAFGATYISPQEIDHDNVSDFDGDGTLDTLTLEAPAVWGGGVAWEATTDLLLASDVKFLPWSDAEGYKAFDWNDQWVFSFGAQYKASDAWTMRAGYNYGTHPVDEHNGWNGAELVSVQGKLMPRYYYETFRIVGFPALVEHHATAGVAWQATDTLSIEAGYMHAFENDIEESGTDIYGNPATLKSTLSENSLSLGVSWAF